MVGGSQYFAPSDKRGSLADSLKFTNDNDLSRAGSGRNVPCAHGFQGFEVRTFDLKHFTTLRLI